MSFVTFARSKTLVSRDRNAEEDCDGRNYDEQFD